MNDVIVEYERKVYFDKKNIVTKIVDEFAPVHDGATYVNAFAYQIDAAQIGDKITLPEGAILEKETDARGRKLIVHKVPVPGKPVCITEYELAGFSFEEGEEQRKAGERLAASYVNFYITNGGVLIPQFEDEMDAEAVNIIGGLFPGRKVYPVYARDIIVGGGNIHCITQQIPADYGRMGGA